MTMKPGTQVITLRIPKELKDHIEAVAAEQDRSVNNMLSRAIKIYLDAYEAKKKGETNHE